MPPLRNNFLSRNHHQYHHQQRTSRHYPQMNHLSKQRRNYLPTFTSSPLATSHPSPSLGNQHGLVPSMDKMVTRGECSTPRCNPPTELHETSTLDGIITSTASSNGPILPNPSRKSILRKLQAAARNIQESGQRSNMDIQGDKLDHLETHIPRADSGHENSLQSNNTNVNPAKGIQATSAPIPEGACGSHTCNKQHGHSSVPAITLPNL